MRYALALICPPLVFLGGHRPARAIFASILFVFAVATARYGVGLFLDIFLVLWATKSVGGEKVGREVRAFIATVKPIPVIRS